jgi:hypothetical protein
MFANTATVAGGGTGYTLNDTITLVGGTPTAGAATYTVSAVSSGVITAVTALNFGSYSALPTNPVSVTGGTGTGATLTVTWAISNSFTISNAGSGYVEQPTVTFSGGGGSGAAAYATVGSGTIIRSLGATGTQSLDFYTPQGITASVPTMRLRDIASDSYPMVNNTTGLAAFVAQGTASSILGLAANGSGSVRLYTNGTSLTEQMRVSNTTSAVNYVQVTGAATGGAPAISAQGSDGTIGLQLTPKGGGNITSVGGLAILNSTAIPAGGTLNTGLRFSSTASFGIFFGSGAPTLSAAQGSIYLRSDGSGTANRMYINTNGSTTWTNVVTAA